MSAMAHDLYDEPIVDVVGPKTMMSEPHVIKVGDPNLVSILVADFDQDLRLGVITPRQLDFSSSFNLVSTAERRTKVYTFILYFDTFFTVTGDPVPPDTAVHIRK